MNAAQPEQLTIRPLRGPELVTVHRISADVFELPYSYDTLSAYRVRARGGFLVALDGTQIIGFVVATSPAISLLSRRIGEIAVLAVDSIYQGRGIGTTLLNAGLDLLRRRKMRVARLHVDTRNDLAVSMYERFGFKKECVIRGYYSNGHDGFRMTLELGSPREEW